MTTGYATLLALLTAGPLLNGDAVAGPVEVKVDVAEVLHEFGGGVAYVVSLVKSEISDREKEKLERALPDLQRALSQLAQENNHLADILRGIRDAQTYPPTSALVADARQTIQQMHSALKQFNEALRIIDPSKVGGSHGMYALNGVASKKQLMLIELDQLFPANDDNPQSRTLDSSQRQGLDDYIKSLTDIAQAAERANEALDDFAQGWTLEK
jgi:tetratricopeptide (TPR) repeat protein